MFRISYRYLIIGDIHATVPELEDCQKLLDYTYKLVYDTTAIPVFLGDLYDTHSIIRAEVQKFWYDNLEKLSKLQKPVLLTGNHDLSLNKASKACALIAHQDQAHVAFPDRPVFWGGTGFFAFYHDHQEMIRMAKSRPFDYLVCHQTFQGAQYENGFYAQDGIDQNEFPQKKIISGHVHLPATLGKVFYPGAPRWRTVSDAEVPERYLYLVDQDLNFLAKYPTSHICSRIHRLVDIQESPLPTPIFDTKDRYTIDIHGDAQFILARKGLYPLARVRVFENKVQQSPILSQRDPLPVSIGKWIENYVPKHSATAVFKEKIQNDPFLNDFGYRKTTDNDS